MSMIRALAAEQELRDVCPLKMQRRIVSLPRESA